MAIVRWDPFGEMLRMQRDLDQIFSRMGVAESRSAGSPEQGWMPKIDIKRSGDDLAIHAELPGIKPEDVDIEVTDSVLTLKGERKASEEREDEGWLVRESSYGSFQRSITLPESVDPATIQAKFADGVLELTVPRAFQEIKPSTVKVAIGGTGQTPPSIEGEATQAPEADEPPVPE